MSTNLSRVKTSGILQYICPLTQSKLCLFCCAICTCSVVLVAIVWCMGASSSTHDMQAPIIVAAQARHTASLIFLHGLGDTGHGWAEAFSDLKLKNVRCVCPTAPIIPVTLNAGMRMPSWFDIKGLSQGDSEDEEGIKKAASMLKDWIEAEEKAGVASNRIMVGGFSQGGAVALYTAFTQPKQLAGVVGLSTWMPLSKTFLQTAKSNSNIPVLQCHGESDPLVQFSWGKKTFELLRQFNSNSQFKSYPSVMHSSCPQEMRDVKAFIEATFPADK